MGTKKFLRNSLFCLLLISLVDLSSCSKRYTEEYKQKQAKINYVEGLKEYNKGKYDNAVEYLRKAEQYMAYLNNEQIKNLKYLLALSLYKNENYEDAILEFEDFITYFPEDKRVESAYFYLIKSYYKISPDPWRDQSYTKKAIDLAQQFLLKFPKSKYRPQIEELITLAKRKLAEHHYLIAKFYEEYGWYYPAVIRYEYLLLNYPDYVEKEKVLREYISCLKKVPQYAQEKIREYAEKYSELKEKIDKGEIKERKPAEKRLQFYLQQIKRWQKISEESLKKAQENEKLLKLSNSKKP